MENIDIGDRIREIRKSRNLNQDQLAELAILNRVTVAKYEAGKVEPGAKALSRIADALEVSADELLGRDPGIKKEAPSVAGLRDGLIDLLVDLSPEEEAQLRAFVAGMKANRKP